MAEVFAAPSPGLATAAGGLALTGDERALVRRIVDAVLPGARVSVFGSRATGRARPHSDLDLLLHEPQQLTLAQRAELRDAFEASTLPFRVDLVAAGELAAGYRARVLGEAVAL